ncbi:MAG: hypothetical protein DI536_32620 [Archangium gephyra]|uniref:Uncharacterized protein n=1 Tax=Archangium gephyra TaxID=48 RepID=A0A2W5SRA9_9BACT|nr:MAG: hypothetical protein DI536_32620 [Archangium gephyra]
MRCTTALDRLPRHCDRGATCRKPWHHRPTRRPVETLANPRPTNAGDITIFRPTGLTNVPVIFFSHAFGATNPDSYRDLFEVLASNGYAVVHVPYPLRPPGNTPVDERYQVLWTGFVTARAHDTTTFDMTRVGFVGHSFGGGATPELARRGYVDQTWGSNGRFMFIMAPWYSWGTGYDTLPADTRTVIQVYADDEANDPVIAQKTSGTSCRPRSRRAGSSFAPMSAAAASTRHIPCRCRATRSPPTRRTCSTPRTAGASSAAFTRSPATPSRKTPRPAPSPSAPTRHSVTGWVAAAVRCARSKRPPRPTSRSARRTCTRTAAAARRPTPASPVRELTFVSDVVW